MSLVENVLIILTCTINVNHNKSYIYQQNPNDRLECYLKSIKQWLELTNFNICVIENSGYKFLELDEYTKKYNDRFEILTFNELNLTNGLEHLIYNCSKGQVKCILLYMLIQIQNLKIILILLLK
jgi:hypothetical protein